MKENLKRPDQLGLLPSNRMCRKRRTCNKKFEDFNFILKFKFKLKN